jgi:FAD/FMN-containing dehydrogenase
MPVSPAAVGANHPDAARQLEALLGAERVRIDRRSLERSALDFSEERLAVPEVVVEPASTDEVAAVARIAHSAGMSLVPRGGGMSYTLAAVPREPRSMVVDLRRMNGLIELSVANRYVTVETGMTWADLRERSRGSGMRPPFLGTLSGLHATIGGGLAQGAAGVGRGHLADCVLGLQVVLADGRVLHTGAGAARDTEPFFRNFGPDLTGLFLGDSGAFGVKTRATLRLDPQPLGTAYGCFAFEDPLALVRAQCELARQGLISECFAWGRYHNNLAASLPSPPLHEAWKLAREVVRSSSSFLGGALTVARAASPRGLRFLRGVPYALLVVVDGFDQPAADRAMRAVRRLARGNGGRPLPGTQAMANRLDPFRPVDQLIIGADGENSIPSNCFVPLARAEETVQRLDGFFRDNEPLMRRHGIFETRLYIVVDQVFGIEPVLYWKDSPRALRREVASAARATALAAIRPTTKRRRPRWIYADEWCGSSASCAPRITRSENTIRSARRSTELRPGSSSASSRRCSTRRAG